MLTTLKLTTKYSDFMIMSTLIAHPKIRLGQQDFHVKSGTSVFPLQSLFDGPSVLWYSPQDVFFQTVQQRLLTLRLGPGICLDTGKRRQETCKYMYLLTMSCVVSFAYYLVGTWGTSWGMSSPRPGWPAAAPAKSSPRPGYTYHRSSEFVCVYILTNT